MARNDAPRGPRRDRTFSSAQLEWVRRNRRGGRSAITIGELAAAVDVTGAGRNVAAMAVFEAISAVVDGTFRRYCTFDDLRGGEVVILVVDRDCLYDIRRKWHPVLMKHLRESCAGKAVLRVSFKLGSGGAPFS